MPSLVELATNLLESAKAVEAHLQSHGLPLPDFDHDLLTSLPKDLQSHRTTLINLSNELKLLAQGPNGTVQNIVMGWTDQVSLRVAYAYNLAAHVPLEGSCSYASLAAASGLAEPVLRRIMRHCMGNYNFAPAGNDEVRHTAISRLLATDSEFRDCVGFQLEDFVPASAFVVEALREFGDSAEGEHTGLALNEQARRFFRDVSAGRSTELPPPQSIYQIFAQEPERGRRFGGGMRYYTRTDAVNLNHLLTGFDWSAVDKPGAVMVDVGGGHGGVSQFLAQHTEHLHFVVQDIPETVAAGRDQLPRDLQGRVEFMIHDFFTPQSRTSDIYFMRWVVHNWSDVKVITILKNLVPAMKPESQIIIFEWAATGEPSSLATQKFGA